MRQKNIHNNINNSSQDAKDNMQKLPSVNKEQ